MTDLNHILVEDCCKYYSIETSFVRTLNDQGLIELEYTNQSYFINHEQLSVLEKYVHLYYDLDINVEGIEAISHLLKKIEDLQSELRQLKED
ncbi:chaperone modulator CbpM [Niabella ginsengisoli]|uniref:Chaperone modulator CbpM n=1 Tax=Niabella ginsengisoli TaxID=522298 RepID=A0ABS9SH44_9BACT|nr:chaperone modulator CbpM [Niabella ginsengisoli]MCH5597693.1 chaperone modulator CbpM [Niabella ginsengisoli]